MQASVKPLVSLYHLDQKQMCFQRTGDDTIDTVLRVQYRVSTLNRRLTLPQTDLPIAFFFFLHRRTLLVGR